MLMWFWMCCSKVKLTQRSKTLFSCLCWNNTLRWFNLIALDLIQGHLAGWDQKKMIHYHWYWHFRLHTSTLQSKRLNTIDMHFKSDVWGPRPCPPTPPPTPAQWPLEFKLGKITSHMLWLAHKERTLLYTKHRRLDISLSITVLTICFRWYACQFVLFLTLL